MRGNAVNEITNDTEYQSFISETKERYSNAQLKAVTAVNEEIIAFYWDLGKRILEKQSKVKWGTNFLNQISKDLRADFPATKGFSVSNLERMRKFARMYPELSAQAVRKLPWGHIVVLIEQIKDPIAREWYAHSVQKNGTARSMEV